MEIELWEDSDGVKPVGEFIKNLSKKRQRWIFDKFEFYEKCGLSHLLRVEIAKEFKDIKAEYGFSLYEFRPSSYRFFFVFISHSEIILLFHSFVKKTDKTPKKEINKALCIALLLNKKYKLK